MRRPGIILVLILFGLFTEPGRGDVVYPARLEVKEIRPGEFSVRFNLPIVNDRRLRAEPILPSVCDQIGEKNIQLSQIEYVESWEFRAPPDSLFGKRIAVRGLLGTQVDVVLFLDLLDGRSYSAVLKPAKAVYEIPSPPTVFTLAKSDGLRGVRQVVTRPEILLFLFLLVFLTIRRIDLFQAALGAVVGFGVGQYFLLQKWVQLSPSLQVFVILALVLLPSLDLVRNREDAAQRLRPFGLTGFIIGIVSGGSVIDPLAIEGLSLIERWLALGIRVAGYTTGLLLAFALMWEVRQILRFTFPQWILVNSGLGPGYVAGTLAVALLLYNGSVLLFIPSIIPEAPPEAYVLAFGVGFWFASHGSVVKSRSLLLLLIPLFGGFLLGHWGMTLPAGSFFVQGTLFFTGLAILTERISQSRFSIPLIGVALCYHGWNAGAFIEENLSLPIAVSVGTAIAITTLFHLTKNASTVADRKPTVPVTWLVGGGIALVAVYFRISEYSQWVEGPIASDVAMGYIPIPLLSLALLAMAVLVWPRRRKMPQLLDLKYRRPLLHWSLIALSFFALPFGTVRATNIFHKGTAPTKENAQRILEQLFTNTYHAFNIENEDELYNQLSESVTGDLVADIYLDSRRKLTSGVREGAEVTVRDVSVLSVGTAGGSPKPGEGYAYECKWSVTARVRHLQHIHHRQNVYIGIVRITVNEERWKISEIALLSEDRVIIPWRSG